MHFRQSIWGFMLMTSITSACAHASESHPSVVSVDVVPLATAKPNPVPEDQAMTISDGKGATAKEAYVYQSTDQKFVVGVASYEPITLEIDGWPYDEYMLILSGKLEVVDADGSHFYGPGQGFVMPKGFKGTWRVIEPIEKVAVAYVPEQ